MSKIVNLSSIREDGGLDTPSSAMAMGAAVKISGSSIALAGSGDRPYGFLAIAVTSEGPSYEELEFIPAIEVEEVKAGTGKIRVILWEPGDIATNKVKSGDTFAVGEKVYVTANGELTNGGVAGDVCVGKVKAVGQSYGGETDMLVVTLSHDLGVHA